MPLHLPIPKTQPDLANFQFPKQHQPRSSDQHPDPPSQTISLPSLPPLTPSRSNILSSPLSTPTPTSSKPIGLGIFSPPEAQAQERKRKRLEAFDRNITSVDDPGIGRLGMKTLPQGEGRVLVPLYPKPVSDSDELRARMRLQTGWTSDAQVHRLAEIPVLPKREALDRGGRERRRLLERFLESEDDEPEQEGVSGTMSADRGGRGKTVLLPFPSAPGQRPWIPGSGDAMLALLAATRSRRRLKLSSRARESSLNLSSASDRDLDAEEKTEVVNCVCESGTDDGTSMVQCDACECWSHMACVGVDPLDLPEQWFCTDCARVRKGKARARPGGRTTRAGTRAAAGTAEKRQEAKGKPKLRDRAKRTKSGLHSPPPTELTRTKILFEEPVTPTRPQREPTFAPADDSGIHGRAAMRMAGAEILVPRTPTPSMRTPWLSEQQFVLPSPERERVAPEPGGYAVLTPLSSRKTRVYSNTYGSPYPPQPISPLRYGPKQYRPDPVGHWHTPRMSDDSDRGSPDTRRFPPGNPNLDSGSGSGSGPTNVYGQTYSHSLSHSHSRSYSNPAAYDFSSTPSRGLKFGAPFSGPLMTPLNFGPFPPAPGKRRSWEAPTGFVPPKPNFGLLTPVVGDDSPPRDGQKTHSYGLVPTGPEGQRPGLSATLGSGQVKPQPSAAHAGPLGAPFSLIPERGRVLKEESDEEGDVGRESALGFLQWHG
ncbi:hypothetical protein DACRYDRAFT_17721 [Dacryopinax primogenitus]|uniref:PHD-type domain-containing protein n=1 Tax=Dacryopinax primogenitus (strain DJM 731) TaxID=1858805 RepID=M5FZS8_DACPD|nr:uncharacterized protein DACRYDRAFT_17721 [Dacryopinax primogenitus]EJT99066.1 hypothetical protein DACRYDRAFT_17721 [Dacryopinax primogenitus]